MLFKAYPTDICFLSDTYRHFFALIFWQGPYYNNVMARHTISPGVCTSLERSGDHMIVIWSLSELGFKNCPKPIHINLCDPRGDLWTLRRASKPSKNSELVFEQVPKPWTRELWTGRAGWNNWVAEPRFNSFKGLVQGSAELLASLYRHTFLVSSWLCFVLRFISRWKDCLCIRDDVKLAQLVRVQDCQFRGRWFDSDKTPKNRDRELESTCIWAT